MNRLRALLPLVLLLAACAPAVEDLPPEEVLRRAMQSAQTTPAAAFTVDGTMALSGGIFGAVEGQLHAEGLIQDGGNTVGTTIDLTVQSRAEEEEGQMRASALLETILVLGGRLYLKVHRLESPSDTGVLDPSRVAALTGTWWVFDAPEEASPSVTPSIRLLQAQASVVRVTADLGATTIDNVPVYHYAVVVDPERFLGYMRELHRESMQPLDEERMRKELSSLQATGELWISAESFSVEKILWDIPALPLPEGSVMQLQFTVQLHDARDAPPIVIPSDAKPFSAGDLLPAEDLQREQGVEWETTLPEGVSEEDIRSVFEEQSDTLVFPPTE